MDSVDDDDTKRSMLDTNRSEGSTSRKRKKTQGQGFQSVHTISQAVGGKERADSFFAVNYKGVIVEANPNSSTMAGYSGFVLENRGNGGPVPSFDRSTFNLEERFFDTVEGSQSPGPKYNTTRNFENPKKAWTIGAHRNNADQGRDAFVFGSLTSSGLLSPTIQKPIASNVGPGTYKPEIPKLALNASLWGHSGTKRFNGHTEETPGAGHYDTERDNWTRGVKLATHKEPKPNTNSVLTNRSKSAGMLPGLEALTQRAPLTSHRKPVKIEIEVAEGVKQTVEYKKRSTFATRTPDSAYTGKAFDKKCVFKGLHSPGPAYFVETQNWRPKYKTRNYPAVAGAWR
jgi:hypothetical protein